MASIQVRYIVDDVDAAISFYERLGFELVMHPAPPFAMLSRGELRLVLSAPNPMGGGGQPMPDGTAQSPGGWNRFAVEVDDLDALVARLRESGARFRNDIVTGVGGKQILLEDPSGNPVELFEPLRPEARLDSREPHTDSSEMPLTTIGTVRSPLRERKDAPRQGSEGAPDARIEVQPDFARALDGIATGDEIIVITWLHRADRAVLEVHPRSNPSAPLAGVFATRSPDRPNPLGLHVVTVQAIDGTTLLVGPIEAIDGTPVVDIKPALRCATM
jgi:tRNA-Thr(GGU) m(6)t(6)A37 methyltransferase TsaA